MTKLSESIEVLIDITIDTDSFDSVEAAIYENKDKVAKALQFIGDANFESYIHIAHQTLWKVCPAALEDHVMGCAQLYSGLISDAWKEFNTDCSEALNAWLNEPIPSDTPVAVAKDVEFLESCLKVS